MQVVKISINLLNPNEKPGFEFYEITKESNYFYLCQNGNARMPKGSIGNVRENSPLNYSICIVADSDDYLAIEQSKESFEALQKLYTKVSEDMDCYRKRLEGCYLYYIENMGVK